MLAEVRESQRRWLAAHPGYQQARDRKHPEKSENTDEAITKPTANVRPPRCAYEAAHREELNACSRAYRAIHRDRLNAQARARRAAKNDSKKRQVTPVYRRSKSAGKLPFPATFGDARRAFQAAIQAQYVVAATRDRT